MIERAAWQKLHRDEVDAALLCDVVDGDDAGVIEGGGRLCFLSETASALRVAHLVRAEGS